MTIGEFKNLPLLNIPHYKMRLVEKDGNLNVYDRIRDKFVSLTPEEYVRQQFTSWLIDKFGYPQALIANEVAIKLNGTLRRCDTLIYGRDNLPHIIIEYKAPDVAITQDVFDQIVRYNMVLNANYLVVSNGLSHYFCRMDYEHGSYDFVPRIPSYKDTILPLSEN